MNAIFDEYEQKELKVQGIFNSIAPKYDMVNSLISFGRHHCWRRIVVKMAAPPAGGKALDLCCGTGLITIDLAKKAGPEGSITGLDFSANMLNIAQERLKHFKWRNTVEFNLANIMKTPYPYPENTFDCAIIGYGLRNVSDPRKVINEMKRVVKPGGRVVALEMAQPFLPVFKQVYNFYLNSWVPLIGKYFARSKDAYEYLHDSIISFNNQKDVIKIYQELGLKKIQCFQLTWGVAAIYLGIKTI